MQQVFKIDMNKISAIKKRAGLRMLKILGITFAVMMVAGWFLLTREAFINNVWLLPVVAVILSFKLYRGLERLAYIYKTLEITLTDTGVERTADTWGYRIVKWPGIQIKYNLNGTVDVFDRNISSFSRMMYGRGSIQIQPEIENVDLLIEEIQRKMV